MNATAATILVVDDEPDLRTLYELTLLREGYRVETAGSVEEAREQLQSRGFDAVITDPPYADAVNYHELSNYFLAWYDKQLASAFPEWTPDARAELAVRGTGENFRRSMLLSRGSVEVFINRPISGTLISLIAAFILWQTVSFFRQRGKAKQLAVAEPVAS